MGDVITFLLPVALGVGLAAAAGLRVFVPLLLIGLSARSGYLALGEDFLWIASTPALVMFAVAAILEIVAYYVPVLDNLLDGVAGPTAVGAGIAISAAVMAEYPPMLKWTLAILAGGGAAAAAQAATTVLRGSATVLTGGTGNHLLATGEIFGSVILTVFSLVLPWLAAATALILLVLLWRAILMGRRRKPA